MYPNGSRNKSELAKAESALKEAEAQQERIRALIEERKSERQNTNARMAAEGTAGNVDALIALQTRLSLLDKGIVDLVASSAECAQKVEAARRYRGKEPEELRWGTRIEVAGVMDLVRPEDVIGRIDAWWKERSIP